MADETRRKTLANCKNSEFLSRANKVRKMVYEAYHAIDVKSIAERYRKKYEDKVASNEITYEFVSDIIDAIMTDHPEETVKLVAAAAFLTEEEAENLDPAELYTIFIECATSPRVLDFFISVERSAGNESGGILPALIFLRLINGMASISASESQSNTSDTVENAPAGDMSESA